MQADTGNVYGPDDVKPEGVDLIEIEKAMYDALVAERQKDVEAALRASANKQKNPGR